MATEAMADASAVSVKLYGKNEKRPWQEFRPVMASLIIGMHLLAIGGVVWHAVVGFWPSAAVIWTAVGMYIFTGFGVALGYHRLFTHQGYKCGPILRTILAIGGALSAEGRPASWIRTHRRHHVYSDRPGDAHSPFQYGGSRWLSFKGVLWSHVGWLFYRYQMPVRSREDDIDRDRTLQWLSNHYWVAMLTTFGLPALIGGLDGYLSAGWHGLFVGSLSGFLIAGALRVVFFLNITWCINSVSHLVGELVAVYTYTARDGKEVQKLYFPSDGSRNAPWWLKWLSFGEANHALHHLFAVIAFHGWRKWDVDPSKWALIVLEKCGLVWDIQRPPKHDIEKVKEAAQLDLPGDTFIPVEWLVKPTEELARTA